MDTERDHRFDFGVFIAMRREEVGLSETLLAEACGVAEFVYLAWEECKALPSSEEKVQRVAEVLRLPKEELLNIYRFTLHDVRRDGFADRKKALAMLSWEQ